MNIHWIQHVDFEGLGCIAPWLAHTRHNVTRTRLWAGEPLPDSGAVDGLIVMGGPMGIDDDEQYAWLPSEKAFLREVIDQNKPVLGICLGAQLIASVLGAGVQKNKQKEIGFFPLCAVSESPVSCPWRNQTVFHWHGDTFDVPAGASLLASSDATRNQAFIYRSNVLALQFHLETTEDSLLALYENASNEIVEGPCIQPLDEMRGFFAQLNRSNELMFALLKQLF